MLGVVPKDISLNDIFASIWPFLIIQFVAMGAVIAFPQIALWLPGTMAKWARDRQPGCPGAYPFAPVLCSNKALLVLNSSKEN